MQRHSIMVSDVHDPHTIMPFYSQEHEYSCAAAPIMRGGKVAGALIVSCRATHFFTEEKLILLERYADLIQMAFYDADFFDASRIELAILPDWKTQNTYFSSFRQRVSDEYKQSLPGQSMQELTTIETRVRQALEKELIQLGMLSKNPSS
ncbi:hypothetical protein KDW_07150 [Dictyobacter vulcani]|uniref:GAF domain-containing protein n=1 Tax=Dictyobacter vulcani TaxID=2607529 RepID=A0A5J4KFV6_9CHLR|nr:hypothetical protein KDW_07150 [Dictyobacter vulcani]